MIVGIDPGIKGGIAVLNNTGALLSCIDIDTIKIEDKNIIDAKSINKLLSNVELKNAIVIIEKVHAMPKQGVTSMFTFGYGCGLIDGAVYSAGNELIKVTPQAWKKHFGLIGEDKKAGIKIIERIYPNRVNNFYTPRGRLLDGRIDAVLIARYYYERYR